MALAKAKPGQVTYGSSGIGGILHLASELFCFLAGVQMTHVPYKGVAEAYPAVASGTVNWVLGSPISALPLLRAGRLKGIAVTGTTRDKTLPELPTIAESGVPGYDVTTWFGLFAPARVPADIVEAPGRGAERRAAARRSRAASKPTARILSRIRPRNSRWTWRREYEKWRGLVKKAGIKL